MADDEEDRKRVAEIEQHKGRLDTSRRALESFIHSVLAPPAGLPTPSNGPPTSINRDEGTFKLDLLKLDYEMKSSDFQYALHEAAEARSRRAAERQQQEMNALEEQSLERADKSDAIQQAMTKATESMTTATWFFGGMSLLLAIVGVWFTYSQANLLHEANEIQRESVRLQRDLQQPLSRDHVAPVDSSH